MDRGTQALSEMLSESICDSDSGLDFFQSFHSEKPKGIVC